ncbi:MAG: hypothetical protein WAK13_00320 [Terriglobales bacterium]
MLILLQDAQGIPGVFHPFGAIPEAELRAWLRQTAIVLPSDLIGLWEMTGGRDIFDTETVFRPLVPSIPNACFAEDDIEGRNAAHAAKGKPSGLYIFQEGAFLSAIRLSDQKFVTLTKDYTVEDSFGSLDDWYIRTLRAEFGERYGLAPLGT